MHAAFSNKWCACSVWFNFLGRDFFNALSEKDTERFTQMLIKWLCSLFVGIPVSHHSILLHSNYPQLRAIPNACTSALTLAGVRAERLLPQCTVPGMEGMDDQ